MTVLFLKILAHRMEFGVKRSILARNEWIACRFSCGIFVYSGYFQFGNDHCFFLSRKSIFRYIFQIIRAHILAKSLLKSRFREFLGNCLTLLFSNHSVLRVFPEASIALQAEPYILYCGANFEGTDRFNYLEKTAPGIIIKTQERILFLSCVFSPDPGNHASSSACFSSSSKDPTCFMH